MQFSPLLALGAALVVGGLAVLWRDLRNGRRLSALQPGPGHDERREHISLADVEITYPDMPAANVKIASAPREDSALAELRHTIERVSAELAEDEGAATERSDKVVTDWAAVQSRIDASIDSITNVLRDVAVTIGPPGQPGWSCNNHGFGSFRRIMIAGESVAWLRLELSADKRLICIIKSHGDEMAALNANESITSTRLSDSRIAGLVSSALQPITKYATRNASKLMSEKDNSESLWRETEVLVSEAIEGASNALRESNSGLAGVAQAEWDEEARRHRLVADVMLGPSKIAKIYVERPTARHIECLVIPPSGALAKLSRRQRIDTNGLSVAKLAEMFVTCAWPSIEHAWNARAGSKIANL